MGRPHFGHAGTLPSRTASRFSFIRSRKPPFSANNSPCRFNRCEALALREKVDSGIVEGIGPFPVRFETPSGDGLGLRGVARPGRFAALEKVHFVIAHQLDQTRAGDVDQPHFVRFGRG